EGVSHHCILSVVASRMARPASGSGAIKPTYLVAGADEGKIEAALARLRARAEREGGPGALESFAPDAGQGPPDAGSLVAAIPSMSLMASRRYLLADGVERWTAKQAEPVIAALGAPLPPLAPRIAWQPRGRLSLHSSTRSRDGCARRMPRSWSWSRGVRSARSREGSRCIPTRPRC